MKFTKSLIATSVMAAAATASAKTTMSVDGEAFYQQTTYENDVLPFDDDQKVGKGFTLDSLDLGFTSQWDGFSTHLGLDAVGGTQNSEAVGNTDELTFEVEYFNATVPFMANKLAVTIGRQADGTGGNIGYGALGDALDNSMDGVSARYDLGKGAVTVLGGASNYTVDFDNDSDEATPGLDSRNYSKFMASPYFGFGYDASYGAVDVLFQYATRSSGEYKAGDAVIMEDVTQTWMALGLGYTMGATSVGFDYLTMGQTKTLEAGEDTEITEMALEVSHKAGMITPTFSYAQTTTTMGDAEATDNRMGLEVTYGAGNGFDWFFSYDQVTTETKDSDPSDKATESTIKLGAYVDVSAEI